MKRFFIVTFVVGLSAFGCKSSSSGSSNNNNNGPTGPTTPNTTTTTTTYTTALKTSNEVPPVTGAEGNVSGSATITLRATKDAGGTVTSATADFQVSLTGLPAGSTITMAHIHPGNNTQNNGILVNTGITSSDVTIAGGNASFTRNGVNVSASDAQGILNNPANFYFNVHSAANGGGLARGQVDGSGAPANPNPNNPNPDPTDPYPYMSVPKHH